MKYIVFLFFLSVANFSFGVSADSPVFGFYKGAIPANSEAYIGITSTRTPVFTGIIESVNTGSYKLMAKGEPNWSSNEFVFSETQPEHYYLKITSGELEGAWYDILSNDARSLEIEIGANELAKLADSAEEISFQIIPHWTMATLFPEGAGFSKATKFSATLGATILYKYTAFGENGVEYPIGVNYTSMQRFNYREFGSTKNWIDANKKDASNVLIEPNAVFVASQPEGVSCEYSYTGNIPMCATSFVLFTLNNGEAVQDQEIYLPVPAAVDFEIQELTPALIDSGAFVPSTTFASSAVDKIYAYENKKVGKNLTSDNSFYYRSFGNTKKWLDVNKQDAQTYKLSAGTVLIIRKKATVNEVAARCKFTPNYISK